MTAWCFVLERSIEYRPGSPTETHTCDSVRAVPDELRSTTEMRPNGLDNFYQKYTEAYGIPVIGKLGTTTRETCLMGVSNNTGADQPAHPRSLISAFVFSPFVAEETGLNLTLSETSRTGFVATRPNYCVQ